MIKLQKEYIYLLNYIKPKLFTYSLGLLGSCFITASLIIMQAFAWKDMFNAAVNLNNDLLYRSIIIFFIPVVLLVCISPFFVYLYSSAVKKVMFGIRRSLFDKILKLPSKYHDTHHSGEIYSVMTNDITLIESAYLVHIRIILYQFILIIASLFSMLLIDWKMAIPLFLVCISFAFVTSKFSKSLGSISKKIQNQKSKETQNLIDILGGIHVIRIFNLNKTIGGKYKTKNKRLTRLGIFLGHKQGQLEGITFLAGFLNHGGIYVLGAFMIMNGLTELGTLTALVSLQINVSFAFLQIGSNLSQLQISIVGINRLNELKKKTEEQQNYNYSNNLIKNNKKLIGIEFNKVTFSYKSDEEILKNLSFFVEKGSKVAFVGSSGSGKSTIAKLIMGLYPIEGGEIYVDGIPVRALLLDDLRSLIAYVPQEVILFDGTVEENIRFGNSNATNEEVITAAIAANAHNFISDLKDGYQTHIGETGRGLSGGEKQRIAIARAILKNAPILIFDEATSSLDTKTEELVQDALNKLIKDRTTLIITHRLSTIQNADRIYVMDKGAIVENGTHEELLSKNSKYKSLVQTLS
ncbi:ABC transporter ATP-binding protein [Paenibacillus beijingensis]|uniref:ABC transporter ATP-binding protein n=1 Tax=Paenibacillus beijingensis TaxID=1126833 RepID=A0A0D5NMX4_9BACL|nr:ABC transporter ATP-binding protein [Paenibacillus beijingensis]AJY76273.1 hypothetical protein VN24_19040 [Paenibacillus beijingensis]